MDKNKKNFIKEFFKAKAFIISVIIILIYAIFFHNDILLDENNLPHIFAFFLSLFPLIIAIFTILISFIDNLFLKFLKETKTKDQKISIYEGIITYFVMNTSLSFTTLIITGFALCFGMYKYIIVQYILIFLFSYTIISFIQVIRFIFYFAKKKADFVEIVEKKKKD